MPQGQAKISDWIGLFKKGDPNQAYLSYQYNSTAATRASLTFNAPLDPGTYEFRYFPDNGYEASATSNSVVVGE